MGCGNFDKVEFLDKIDSIRQHTFKKSSICSAFRATGLIPYNPDVVIAKLREALIPQAPREPTTPPPVAPLTMPLTIHSLKRLGEELQREAADFLLPFNTS